MDKQKLENTLFLIEEAYGEKIKFNFEESWNPEKEEKYFKEISKIENRKSPEENKRLFNKENLGICQSCNEKLTTIEDDIFFVKFKCCHFCYIKKFEGRKNLNYENQEK